MPKFFENHDKAYESDNPEQEHFSPKMGEAGEVKTLLSWEAAARPFRPKDRSFYTTVAIIVTLLSMIAFFASEFLLIAVILSVTFVAYVLAYIPPNNVTYKISTQGIIIGDHFYFWHDLDSFWLKEKEGHKVLFIQTLLGFPGQLMLVLGDNKEEEVKNIVARFLPFHEIPHTTMLDRWAEGLQKHFPLENTHK